MLRFCGGITQPKKSFDSLEQFEAFKLQAMVYWQEAKKRLKNG
jgi:hypothetical protein